MLHLHRQRLAKQHAAQHQIRLFTSDIQQVGPHIACNGLKDHRDRHTDAQRPQGDKSLVGHHPVIDVHGEKDAGQRQHVHQYRADGCTAVVAAIAPQGVEQPVAGRPRRLIAGAGIDPCGWLDQNGMTGIHRVHLCLAEFDRLIAQLRQDQLVAVTGFFFAIGINPSIQQNAGTLLLAQQDHWHQLLWQGIQAPVHQTSRETGIGQRCQGQRWREQAALGQAGGESLGRLAQTIVVTNP